MIEVLGYDFAIAVVLYYQSYMGMSQLIHSPSQQQMSFKACSQLPIKLQSIYHTPAWFSKNTGPSLMGDGKHHMLETSQNTEIPTDFIPSPGGKS